MFNTKYRGKKQESPGDWTFYFEKPVGYIYIAGQYAVLRMPMKYEDSRFGARTCSISSCPSEDNLAFTFFYRESGFKKTLMELTPGDMMQVTPARGSLILPKISGNKVVMIAGGVGVSPYRAMLRELELNGNLEYEIKLLYSDINFDQLLFNDYFCNYHKFNPKFEYYPTLTRENPKDWIHGVGRLNSQTIIEKVPDLLDWEYMLCGSDAFVENMRSVLAETCGVSVEKTYFEVFTGY